MNVSMVNPATDVGAVAAVSVGQTAEVLPASESLPEPAANLPMTLEGLLILQQRLDSVDFKGGAERLAKKSELRKEKLDKAIEEFRKALEEQSKKGGGWFGKLLDDMGPMIKLAAVAASIAAAVGTCGAAAPVVALAWAGAGMSAAGYLQGELHVLEKFGMDADTASTVGTVMTIGGGLCTMGAGVAGGAAVASEGTEQSINSAQETARVLGQGVQAAEGAEMAARGVIRYMDAEHDRKAEHHNAEALLYQMQREWLSMEMSRLLDDLEYGQDQAKQAVQTLHRAIQIKNDTPAIVAAKV